MICLTGDVHHMSLFPRHQKLTDGRVSEVACLEAYLMTAARWGVKATVFLTGKAAEEETARLRAILDPERVEVGGHTYSAFRPRLLYGAASRLLRLSNGPAFLQDRDIARTVAAIRDRLGVRIRSWRNHAYRHDRNTDRLLRRHGIRFVSDEVRPLSPLPTPGNGSPASIPINTTPDHENLPHYRQDAPYTVDTWAERIREEVRLLHAAGSPAVILAHPSCMFVEDGLAAFDGLCRFLAGFPSVFMRDLK